MFFPHTPTPYYEFPQLEDALVFAIEHDVKPVSDKTPIVNVVLRCFHFPLHFLTDALCLAHTTPTTCVVI